MVFYPMSQYRLIGFRESTKKNKMYDAILRSRAGETYMVPFGDVRYQNYRDKTGVDAYPHLIHGDKRRRKNYRARHAGYLEPGYFSPGYFSYYYLW